MSAHPAERGWAIFFLALVLLALLLLLALMLDPLVPRQSGPPTFITAPTVVAVTEGPP